MILSIQQTFTGEHLKIILNTIVPILLGGIGTFIMFLANRGLFDRFINRQNAGRRLAKLEHSYLKKHLLFSSVDRIVKLEIPTFTKEVANNTSEVFYLCFAVSLEQIKKTFEEFVNNLPMEADKNIVKNMTTDVVCKVWDNVDRELKVLGVPDKALHKFDFFTLLHGHVISLSSERVIMNADSYFNEINHLLNFMWSMVTISTEESRMKRNTFNGDIEKLLTPEVMKVIKF